MTPQEFAALPPEQAIAYLESLGVALPEDFYRRAAEYRLTAFTVSGITSLDALDEVLRSLTDAVASGETFAQWRARALDTPGMGALPAGRLETVFRTNVQGAYQRGTYQRQAEIVDRRPYLMYDAINDARTRPTHRAMDGYIARYDDPIWKRWRAPAGFNCRCGITQLSESQARARGYGTQSPPQVEPDDGWDYDRAAGIDQGVAQAVDRHAAGSPIARRAPGTVDRYRRAAGSA